jgi:ATP/maltotriose-dependent transcriptional regulator MalT
VPFVSRGEELGVLDEVLKHLGNGGPAVVDVVGGAGIGKSRMLAEFSTRARRHGVTVLRGRATEFERHSPFQPFADAFADLDRKAVKDFPLLAELTRILRDHSTEAGGRWSRDRFGLYQAMAQLLGRLRGTGLVVVLDDLHWADAASQELLDHLVRHPVPAPVLLVVARRDRQAPAGLAALLARGVDTGAVQQIPLGPLGERACVEHLAPDLSRPQAVELYAASGGNPLYFLALLHARRAARRSPTSRNAPWPNGTDYPAQRRPPTGLESLLLDELTPLSELERTTVEVAAVLGDYATPELIGVISQFPVVEVIEALRRLMLRDLVRPDRDGGRLTLRHPLVRALVHENIDPWRRGDLHRLVAAEFARAGAPLVDQAHHVEHALTGWDPQGAAVLIKASEQTATTAPAISAHWLGVVLRILPATSDHLRQRGHLMVLRARTLCLTGHLEESRELLHQVIDMPVAEDNHAVRTSAVALCALVERSLGRYQQAEALLRRELDRHPGPSQSQQIEYVLELGSCALLVGRYPQIRPEIARTLAAARALGDEIGEVRTLAVAAMGETYEGNVDAARTSAQIAARLADALTDSDLVGLCESLARLSWSEATLDNFTDAERHADRGLALARLTGRVYMLSQLLLCKAYIHILTCRVATALELTAEAETVARGLGSGELLGFALAIRSMALLQAHPPGDHRPLAAAEEAVAAVGTSDSRWATLAQCMLACTALAAGDPHRARDVLLRAGGGSDLARLQPSVRPSHLEVLVTAALATSDPTEAEQWAERAAKEAKQLGLPTQRGAALHGLAQIDAHRGDPASAARKYTDAAQESARCRATLREAQSLLLGAPLMKAAGEGSRGAAMWHRGRRLAAEGGAGMLVSLAEQVRPAVFGSPAGALTPPAGPPRPAGPRDPVRPADPSKPVESLSSGTTSGRRRPGGVQRTEAEQGLDSLTPREQEIADLVAIGLTNQAIATRLYLSTRTVESHVARIFRKTGVSSRAVLATLVTQGAVRGKREPPRE